MIRKSLAEEPTSRLAIWSWRLGVFSIPDGNVSIDVAGLAIRNDGTILVTVRSSANGIVYAFTPSGQLDANYGSSGAAVLSLGSIGTNFPVAKSAMIHCT